jgi:hypothetical protein
MERERDPHHALNNPASDPDPTEWPDPYDRRPDPLAPEVGEGEEPRAEPGATSTSQPHTEDDPEAPPEEARKRDKLDRSRRRRR